jgi:hypothetical protein
VQKAFHHRVSCRVVATERRLMNSKRAAPGLRKGSDESSLHRVSAGDIGALRLAA